jgi:hypothetical protein
MPSERIPLAGSVTSITQAYDRNLCWAYKHYGNLLARYENDHVAVRGERVIANSRSLVELKDELTGRQNPEDIVIMKVWPGRPQYIV